MSTAVRRLKINRRYAAAICSWCGEGLNLGDNGSVCEACECPYHSYCWDQKNGCGSSDCINAPLQQVPNFFPPEDPLVEMSCLECSQPLPPGITVCSTCAEFQISDQKRYLSDEAHQAFLLGIATLLAPPLVLLVSIPHTALVIGLPFLVGAAIGWRAWKKAEAAKKEIAADQSLKGTRLAIAAQVLGLIGMMLGGMEALGVLMMIFNK